MALPIIVGALAIGQSLITDWELSVANLLPLSAHLMMDVVAGIVLAVSPFVFGFSDDGTNAWLPHVIAGVGLVAAGMLTRRTRESAGPVRSARSRPAHR